MANEFIARNGLIAQNNTTITGSLTVTGPITGSISSASFATTASYAMNGGSGGGIISFPFSGSAVISGSLEIKNQALTLPSGSIFAPTNNFTTLYASSSISQSTSFNITNSALSFYGTDQDSPTSIYVTFYVITYSNQYHAATSAGYLVSDSNSNGYTLVISPGSVQSPATITGYDIYGNNGVNWKRQNYLSAGAGPFYIGIDDTLSAGYGWVITSSLPNLTNLPVPGYSINNNIGISKSSSLNGVLDINGNTIITGSLNVTAGITGSLLGSASFASTSSYLNTLNQNVFITGSFTITGSTITTGSVIENTRALSIASNTASLNLNSGNFFTLQLVPNTNTFINPSNITPGQTTTMLISTTGSATVSFSPSVLQISGSSYIPTITTGKDLINMISFNTSSLYLVYIKNLI